MNPKDRPRCAHCGHLIDLKTGACWACGREPEEPTKKKEKPMRSTITMDAETGEVIAMDSTQPTLDSVMFPAIERRDVPTVKVSFSGSIEMSQGQLDDYLEGAGLKPGQLVEVRLVGYLPAPHAKWVQRQEHEWEQEGVVKIKAVEVVEMNVSGGLYCGE